MAGTCYSPLSGIWPRLAPDAFVAPGAVVVGDVEIGSQSSIWFGCVLRGDVHSIRIGARTNIQDGTVIHVTTGGQGTQIGDDVTIGHAVLLHDCVIESGAFIGMRAIVLDGARVASGGMLGAGALLPQGRHVPGGELWLGAPARFARSLRSDENAMIHDRAAHYAALGQEYLSMQKGNAA
ncbi:MAG: gamma carbonic anhydrase family protein [Alphaproteobacteria bacterium]|nr:MAG: gamma carbonic anhydrase family protein [Alphaproteobacteria bacterium]